MRSPPLSRSRNEAPLEMRVLAGFIASVALLLVAGGLTYWADLRFAESAQWIARSEEVRTALAALYGSLAGAEVALRDYVITGEPQQHDEYGRQVLEVERELDDIALLLADDRTARPQLLLLGSSVTARLRAMQSELSAFNDFGLSAVRAVITLGVETNSTLSIRQLIDRMATQEGSALEARQYDNAAVRAAALASLLATLTVGVVFFTGLYRGIQREMRARRNAERALRESIAEVERGAAGLLEANLFLDSLIDNLPVMVVVKDATTLRATRINRAAERLLGVSREEFVGRTATELFKADEAAFITAGDHEALVKGRLVDIREHRIHTNHLGARTLHSMTLPLNDEHGQPLHLLGLSVDITERKLAEQAIHELNAALMAKADQLSASNRELESFSYSVSHDLRAPLRAIDGFAQMLEEDSPGRLDSQGRRYLRVIRTNSARMGVLIDDLLALSRLGRQPVITREVNVDSLVREVVEEELQHRPGPACIEIGPLPAARADPGLLRQVWTNLISNALKYSSKAALPRIEVSGRHSAGEIQYSIRDNGVGFDMEYADPLFGVFQRLHPARDFDGNGIGLAIVERVVTRHGGRVWAEGKVDAGAVFSFALPDGVGLHV